MLCRISRKGLQALAFIIILSILMTAMTAFAATKFISARRGGMLRIAPGVLAIVRPKALEEDTIISADMSVKRDRISFTFGPSGTEFLKPMALCVSWRAIDGVEDLTIYGEDGEEIEPARITGRGVKYHINHFSVYYFRRR